MAASRRRTGGGEYIADPGHGGHALGKLRNPGSVCLDQMESGLVVDLRSLLGPDPFGGSDVEKRADGYPAPLDALQGELV